MVASQQALLLSLLNPLEQSGFQTALAGLPVMAADDRYADEQLRLALVLLSAKGVLRISHINDEPLAEWGPLLNSARRPDGATLDQYLNRLIELDEENPADVVWRLGQIRPGGLIDQAQQQALTHWAEAQWLDGDVWYFDSHTLEYSGEAPIGQTKHGTQEQSVKAVVRYTLHNGLCSLSEYFPASVTYSQALRQMIVKANRCLPPEQTIRKLAFDQEGWDGELLTWLSDEQGVAPVTWVKNSASNLELLAAVPDAALVAVCEEMTLGKVNKSQVKRLADTVIDFADLGRRRVVVVETTELQRMGIYTSASPSHESALDDQQTMTTVGLLEAMRLKQRIENGFKLDVHEMASDAIPTHKRYAVELSQAYDLGQAHRQQPNAQRRLSKYTAQAQQEQELHAHGQIDKHQLRLLSSRTQRLRQKAAREVAQLTTELACVQVDDSGEAYLATTSHVRDLRKLTLLNLFKAHARVALAILVSQLGLRGAGPQRLRREFFAFGDRVEFDHDRQMATVYARRFPRASTRQAYEQLCGHWMDVPIRLIRNGVSYRLRFNWEGAIVSELENNNLRRLIA